MKSQPQAPTTEDAIASTIEEPSADVRAWQVENIKRGLKAADEGRFASPEAVKRVVRKHIPNG